AFLIRSTVNPTPLVLRCTVGKAEEGLTNMARPKLTDSEKAISAAEQAVLDAEQAVKQYKQKLVDMDARRPNLVIHLADAHDSEASENDTTAQISSKIWQIDLEKELAPRKIAKLEAAWREKSAALGRLRIEETASEWHAENARLNEMDQEYQKLAKRMEELRA